MQVAACRCKSLFIKSAHPCHAVESRDKFGLIERLKIYSLGSQSNHSQ